MNALPEFDDVIAADVQVEEVSSCEFEFDDGAWCLRKERNHWEIFFEDMDGEVGMIVEREDFIDGKFEFDIDGTEYKLLLDDFDRIDKFAHEKGLIK
jgi:hypothetical protein